MSETFKDIATILLAGFTLLLLLSAISWIFFARVPYVPSKQKLVNDAFNFLKVKKGQKLYDLGAGDGRILFFAEKFELQAEGYEISPLPYLIGKIATFILHSKAKLIFKNYNQADLSTANYVYCYLFPEFTENAYQKVKKECQRGTYFISNTFTVKSAQPVKIIADQNHKSKLFIYQI